MTLTILGTFAEFEHSTIHERTMDGRKQKAKQGIKSLGRRVPLDITILMVVLSQILMQRL